MDNERRWARAFNKDTCSLGIQIDQGWLKKTSFELRTNTIPVPDWLKPERFVCFVKVSTNMMLFAD